MSWFFPLRERPKPSLIIIDFPINYYQFYLQKRVPSFDVNTFETCADFLMRPS